MDFWNRVENSSAASLSSCASEASNDCDVFILFDKNKSERTTASFVALCRKESEGNSVYDKCEVAKIIAGVEVKN